MATPASVQPLPPRPLAGRLPDGRWRALEIAFWLIPVDLLLPVAELPRARQPDPDHRAVRGLARPDPRLRRHRLARARGVLRHRRVHGRACSPSMAGTSRSRACSRRRSVAAVAGYLVSFLVVRGGDLTRLMVTLGIGLMLWEAANKAHSITGGVDGLIGRDDGPDPRPVSIRYRRANRVRVRAGGRLHRVPAGAPARRIRRSG